MSTPLAEIEVIKEDNGLLRDSWKGYITELRKVMDQYHVRLTAKYDIVFTISPENQKWRVTYPVQNVSAVLTFNKDSSQENAACLISSGFNLDDALSIALAFKTILKHNLLC